MRKIFEMLSPLPPTHPKRVNALNTLAQACLDCQQVGTYMSSCDSRDPCRLTMPKSSMHSKPNGNTRRCKPEKFSGFTAT